MKICMVGALFAIAFGACGDDSGGGAGGIDAGADPDVDANTTEVAPPYASGSRLRARLLDGKDGAIEFLGWYDSTLETACAFKVGSDGSLRCLPELPDNQYSTIVFLDAACTQPVLFVPSAWDCGSKPTLYTTGRYTVMGACDERAAWFSAYQIGETVVSPSEYYEWTGSCAGTPTGAEPGTFYGASAVDPTLFVSASKTVELRADGLSAIVAVADDGSREAIGISDDAIGKQCLPFSVSDEFVCLQTPAFWYPSAALPASSRFSDAACATQLVSSTHDSDACDDPGLAVRVNLDQMSGPAYSAFALGARHSDPVYTLASGMCELGPPPSSTTRYHEIGAPLAPDALPGLRAIESGTGALSVTSTGTRSGVTLLPPQWLRDESGDQCEVYRFPDATTRCFTRNTAPLMTGFFADAGCTIPIARGYADQSLAGDTRRGACTANTVLGVWELGAIHMGSIYSGEPGACGLDVITPETGESFYLLGQELSAADFAEVTELLE